jgi:hypothetical protein
MTAHRIQTRNLEERRPTRNNPAYPNSRKPMSGINASG